MVCEAGWTPVGVAAAAEEDGLEGEEEGCIVGEVREGEEVLGGSVGEEDLESCAGDLSRVGGAVPAISIFPHPVLTRRRNEKTRAMNGKVGRESGRSRR